jgi:hypothetical protein
MMADQINKNQHDKWRRGIEILDIGIDRVEFGVWDDSLEAREYKRCFSFYNCIVWSLRRQEYASSIIDRAVTSMSRIDSSEKLLIILEKNVSVEAS